MRDFWKLIGWLRESLGGLLPAGARDETPTAT
jgi:hypothetical protein